MKKVLAACVVLALAFMFWRHREARTGAATVTPATSTSTAGAEPSASPPAHLKQLATPGERHDVEQRIAAARAARAAQTSSATGNAPPKLPAAHPGGLESLPPGALDVLNEAIPFLEKCFGPDAPKDPIVLLTLEGDPDVGTLIDPGQITDDKNQPLDPALTDCLHSTLQSLQLPPMGDGNSVKIQYTFRFHGRDAR